ncbi:MAG: hypothetical protein IJV16_11230 [Lachnospiraceae bacterium]|nr:hypothetical protein [Lachnospiraceae bacterium]
MRLSGWELDDGTLLIESVLPMEDINVIIIGYYDPESEHSSEGIAGFGYNLWQQLSS